MKIESKEALYFTTRLKKCIEFCNAHFASEFRPMGKNKKFEIYESQIVLF